MTNPPHPDPQHEGAPCRKVAEGTERFETRTDGASFVDHSARGEVVWAEEAGLTCLAWNRRQGARKRVTQDTKGAHFLFDPLPPMTFAALEALLSEFSPGCRVGRFRLGPGRPA
ncbi:hypothetical protein [Deinococcus pimensis]|uniref:hypothetical protein n=1 Tax=Deinococcus pimensis TaxID=309888 RepID=UPI0004B7F139|nr:hypothetical protein [Deinococcus pimensis]